LQSFFDQNKLLLTRRAQDKIKNDGLRDALYDQFLYYLVFSGTTLRLHKKIAPLAKDESGFFIVSLKPTGFKKTYRLRYKIDFKRTFFDEQMWGYLESFTKRDGIFILNETKGLGYSNKELSGEIRGGGGFILFYRDANEIKVKSKLENLFGSDWDKAFFREIVMEGPPPGYSFYICKSLPSEIGTLLYKSGTLNDEFIPIKERLKCLGGVILNQTQNLYLKNYPPEEFQAESHVLSPDDIVTVNHIPMKVSDLKDRLLKVDDYDSFYIAYNNFKLDLKIRAPIGIQYCINAIGFNLINNEIINPLARENTLNIPSLRGWVLPFGDSSVGADKKIELEIFEVACLMRKCGRTWIPTTDGAIQMVIDSLPLDRVPASTGKVLRDHLWANKALPVSLIARHRDLELAHTG